MCFSSVSLSVSQPPARYCTHAFEAMCYYGVAMLLLMCCYCVQRISASRALQHAYFRSDGRGFRCGDLLHNGKKVSGGSGGAGGGRRAEGGGGRGGGDTEQEFEFEDEALAFCLS
jgi:hypothetical protein